MAGQAGCLQGQDRSAVTYPRRGLARRCFICHKFPLSGVEHGVRPQEDNIQQRSVPVLQVRWTSNIKPNQSPRYCALLPQFKNNPSNPPPHPPLHQRPPVLYVYLIIMSW
ncbi:hypothetical protein J6590_067213 [Homalodisca vitripennis]|nr:hypothetical protein J6590_067213 [Homalodisca vitripennis]